MKWRLLYALLWLLTVVAYSVPWMSATSAWGGAEVFTGWSFTIPFSITYFIGMLLGLTVLLTRFSPVAATIASGVLMFLGIVGAGIGVGMAKAVGAVSKMVGGNVEVTIEGEWA